MSGDFDTAWATLKAVHEAEISHLRAELDRTSSEKQVYADENADLVIENSILKTTLSRYQNPG